MHGLDHSITFSKILAIDLGKFNSVVCCYDPATTQHSFLTLQTTPQVNPGVTSRRKCKARR